MRPVGGQLPSTGAWETIPLSQLLVASRCVVPVLSRQSLWLACCRTVDLRQAQGREQSVVKSLEFQGRSGRLQLEFYLKRRLPQAPLYLALRCRVRDHRADHRSTILKGLEKEWSKIIFMVMGLDITLASLN
jgi:hypothetical protein